MPGHLFKPGQRHRIPNCHLVRIKDPPIAYCHCMVDLIIRKTQSVVWINPWCKLLLLVREMREGRTSDITHPILSTQKERSNIFHDFFSDFQRMSWAEAVREKDENWEDEIPPEPQRDPQPCWRLGPLPSFSGLHPCQVHQVRLDWVRRESLLLIVLLIEHRNYFYRISDLCHFQS